MSESANITKIDETEDEAYRRRVQEQKKVVVEAREKLAELQDKLSVTKANVKAAAELVGEESRVLLDVIDGQMMLDLQSGEKKGPPRECNPASDEWRSVPVEDLEVHELTPAISRLLVKAELSTIGAIADHTAADKRLTDIPGIGEAKAEKIEKALDGFWTDRNAATSKPEAEVGKSEVQEYCDLTVAALEVHGLPVAIVKALWDAQLTTLGELQAFIDAKHNFAFIVDLSEDDVPLIFDALERFQSARQGAVTAEADAKC